MKAKGGKTIWKKESPNAFYCEPTSEFELSFTNAVENFNIINEFFDYSIVKHFIRGDQVQNFRYC